VIAKSASLDTGTLRSMNPEILRGITPPDTDDYKINLPYGLDTNGFGKNLEAALSSEKRIKGYTAYKVRKGDTLPRILKRYKISYEDIQLVNNTEGDIKIRPGMVVAIPRFNGQAASSTRIAQKAETAGKRAGAKKIVASASISNTDNPVNLNKPQKPQKLEAKTYHVVKKGETLSSISSKYSVNISSLRVANKLKDDKVYPDMKLKLVSHSNKKEKPAVKIHVVKKGETLSSISRKYSVDISSLRAANKLKDDKVYPDMKLKIVGSKG